MLVRNPHLFLNTACTARLGQAESTLASARLGHAESTRIQTQAETPINKQNKLKTQWRRQSSELQLKQRPNSGTHAPIRISELKAPP